jgi:predicted alpha/beta-hydrolase family hydrolase
VTRPLDVLEVPTPLGPARAHVQLGRPARGTTRRTVTTLVLGHGAGGGVEAPDLVSLVVALPPTGVTVVLVEQPWRVAGKRVAGRPATLDQAWIAVLADPQVRDACGLAAGARLVVGGRSAGARVACRTAIAVGASAVVALAFPLHPPGRAGQPAVSRVDELVGAGVPTLVVQGDRDAFGSAPEFPSAAVGLTDLITVAPVPYADHSFRVPRREASQRGTLDQVVASVASFLSGLS